MKFFFTSLFLSFCCLYLIAQPGFNDLIPQIGDSYSGLDADAVGEPLSGDDVIWDYSSNNGSFSEYFTFVEPMEAEEGADFPEATIALEEIFDVEFWKVGVGIMERVGSVQVGLSNIVTTYSNPATTFQAGIPYGGSVSDDFACSYTTLQGIDYERTGTIELSYLGYGTLMLPDNSYDNVILVKRLETYEQKYNLGGVPVSTDYELTSYLWYKTGNHLPIMCSENLTNENGQDFPSGYYLTAGSVSIVETPVELEGLNIFPNPASERLNVEFEVTDKANLQLNISDILGRTLIQINEGNYTPGKYNFTQDIKTLESGYYMLTIQSESGVVSEIFVVK